jgi:hypothetical protein|tara:strand:+ start:612 stop:824 length:213 start_codon:yes stop_codon:yes gene_type:complete
MKPGNLIRISRAAIGVPADSIALILKSELPAQWAGGLGPGREKIHTVQILGSNRTRRYLGRDLEVINESR